MNILNHKANVEESSRTSSKKNDTKSTSSQANEKSSNETRKAVLLKK